MPVEGDSRAALAFRAGSLSFSSASETLVRSVTPLAVAGLGHDLKFGHLGFRGGDDIFSATVVRDAVFPKVVVKHFPAADAVTGFQAVFRINGCPRERPELRELVSAPMASAFSSTTTSNPRSARARATAEADHARSDHHAFHLFRHAASLFPVAKFEEFGAGGEEGQGWSRGYVICSIPAGDRDLIASS